MDILLHFSKNSINFITFFSNFTKKDKKTVIFFTTIYFLCIIFSNKNTIIAKKTLKKMLLTKNFKNYQKLFDKS